MNSASILMTPTAPAPAAPVGVGAQQSPAGTGGFDQALAAAQADVDTDPEADCAEGVSLAIVSGLLARAAGTDEPGSVRGGTETGEAQSDPATAPDVPEAGAAAILAQMLMGSSQPLPPESPPASPTAMQAAALPVKAAPVGSMAQAGPMSRAGESGEAGATTGGQGDGQDSSPALAALESAAQEAQAPVAAVLLDSAADSASGAQPPQPGSQAGNTGQIAVQAAANALRDAAPVAATPAPVHAALREPVGTARWADEIGNHLVLMSVRGQQHGSLTLTPEHLGPVEVQISVSRDTANVWFGAQHADTRAALTEAMPRLRELLASSGLSLGQSGVSEQAPRESFAPGGSRLSEAAGPQDAAVSVDGPASAWRVWRPGLIDTYA